MSSHVLKFNIDQLIYNQGFPTEQSFILDLWHINHYWLMPNMVYTYMLDMYNLVSLGVMAYQPLLFNVKFCLYIYTLNIYDLVGLNFMAYFMALLVI